MARYDNSSYFQHLSLDLPLHLCFFLAILFSFVGFTWYINYESMIEDLMDQLKLILILSPLLLLLLLHILSSDQRQFIPFIIPLPDKDSLHRAGGSPWGVAFLLVFLLFMVSYKSYFQERWFPLLSR